MSRSAILAATAACLLLLAGPAAGSAQAASSRSTTPAAASPGALGPLRVEPLDRTVDGCWSKPDQVVGYAAERLARKGFALLPEAEAEAVEGESVLYIGVIADRVNGTCSGSLYIFVARDSWRAGDAHLVGPDASRISAPKTADLHVLGRVRSFIERM